MSQSILFPGQGSQSVGMLAEEAKHLPQVLETFQEASDILGYDLWAVTQEDEARLNQTDVTQPAILTASVALWRAWEAMEEIDVSFMAGHSLGEFSALVCAGALPFAEAVKLVETRGRLMQSAVPEGVGGMVAVIGLSDEEVTELCQSFQSESNYLAPANFNSPGQVVVAGHKAAFDAFIEKAKEAGAKKCVVLSMSVPSHCLLMQPAAQQFEETLKACSWAMPSVPVIHNATLAPSGSLEGLQQALVAQLVRPVKWSQTVGYLLDEGCDSFVECGPGKVLSGLGKRIDRSASWSNAARTLLSDLY